MTEIKKLQLTQDEFIKWILDNTYESSNFRVYKGMNNIVVGIDVVPLEVNSKEVNTNG